MDSAGGFREQIVRWVLELEERVEAGWMSSGRPGGWNILAKATRVLVANALRGISVTQSADLAQC
jgi:hypothetical protein